MVPTREPDASSADKTPTRHIWRTRRPENHASRIRFRPQVGLLEQRALLTQINLNPYVNGNLQKYSNGTDYPLGGTSLTIGGVAFTLANYTGGGTGVIQTPNQSKPSSFDVAVNIANPTTVYTLINSAYGVYGDTVGAVEFKATGGLDYTVNLVEGGDIRDHNNFEFNNTIGRGALGGNYLGTASYGGGQVRLDKLGFTLPSSFQSSTLTDIILHGYGNNPTGTPFLAAATVATGSSNTLPTRIGLRASTASAAIGQSVTFTATVTDLTPGGDLPNGGTVAFYDQYGFIGSGTLIDGVAAFTTSSLAAGSVTVTASYSGAGEFGSSVTGTIVTFAGNGTAGYKGNNGPATAAELNNPSGMSFDSAGDLIFTDYANNVVREVVQATGDIITVAGNGTAGYTGNGGLATTAELHGPDGVAVDSAGDLFIADSGNNVIREVVKATGDIITVAGNGTAGYKGDNGLATAAELNSARTVAIDSAGDLFIADRGNSVIREVVKATGDIITVAGTGTAGYTGDNGPATAAKLNLPYFVALDPAGDLFIADMGNNRIREVIKSSGDIITFAGNGTAAASGDGGPATAAGVGDPHGLVFDPVGDLFIVEQAYNVAREVVKATGDIVTVAGTGATGYSGDGGPATAADLNNPHRVAIDSAGDLFIADGFNNVIREVTPGVTVTIGPSSALPVVIALRASTTFAGSGGSITFTATVSDLSAGGAIPNGGTVIFSDQAGEIGSGTLVNGIAVFTTSTLAPGTITVTASYGGVTTFAQGATGTIVTVVGNGTAGYEGDNGPASAAELDGPSAMAFDSAGDLFFTDSYNNVVREVVKATGVIITVAGNGTAGYSGDNGPATAAQLYVPDGVAIDSAGDLFISDGANNVVREVVKATGVIITVAGNGTAGYTGNNGPATAAELNNARTVAIDSAGDLFIADRLNNVIREVVKATGDIITFVGNGTAGYSGDNGPPTAAELNHPFFVALDSAGDLFIADTGNNRIREVIKSSGDIITFAGNGTAAASGDGGLATAAGVGDPHGIAFDSVGDMFIVEQAYHEVREVVKATGDIISVAGNGTAGYTGDGGPATVAELDNPYRVAIDSAGDLFIADGFNEVIREVTPAVTVTISNLAAPTISWPAPAPIIYGTALSSSQLDATASFNGSTVAGTFTYLPLPGTILGGGTQTLSVAFNPTDTTDYVPVTAQTTLIVNPATPTIHWPAPSPIVGGTGLGVAQLDATASVPGTFVYTPAAGTVLKPGQSQTLSVTFTPTDTTDYTSVTATTLINVLIATTTSVSIPSTSVILHQALTLSATVSVPAGFAIPVGSVMFFDGTTPLGPATLNASGKASLVVSTLGLGQHSITAFYAGDSTDSTTTSTAVPLYVSSQKGDFDGDGKADLAVYGKIPGTNVYGFTILTSSSGFSTSKEVVWDNQGFGFGNASSIPVVGDYFGDGRDDYAIWSPDGHGFMILQVISSVNPAKTLSIDFGLTTDVPVVADVDGDGTADFGVFGYDPNLGYRYDFLLSSKSFSTGQPLIFNNYGYGYGTAGASPVVADFDGSGHAGFGVYIPSTATNTGTFTYTNVTIPTGTTGPIVNPAATYYFARNYGFAADIPMAVDYDGDGKADLALYGLDPRTNRYRYDILTSSTNFSTSKDVYFDNAGLGYGYSGSIPVMADYEGNGHADFAVFQPDGLGNAEFVFQDVGVGHGVVYDFAPAADLPVTAPAFLLARKVRGH